jgi:hypothetical protein
MRGPPIDGAAEESLCFNRDFAAAAFGKLGDGNVDSIRNELGQNHAFIEIH